MTDQDLALRAVRLRKRVLEVIVNAGAGHTGGDLSCLDILNVLYNRVLHVSPETTKDPHRDRYVQSKDTASKPCTSCWRTVDISLTLTWKRFAATSLIMSAIRPEKSPGSR